jgi:putative hydrolase of HD superfamily
MMEQPDSPRDVYNNKLAAAADRVSIPPERFASLLRQLCALERLLVRFSKVVRHVPVDRDGTPESDADHTVTLALVACSVAAKFMPELDVGKVAQYALVHDLVEAYQGDTSTLEFEAVDRKKKDKMEKKARKQMKTDLPMLRWLHEMLDNYERLKDPEARFVRTLDKAMPALLHNINDGFIFEFPRAEFEEPGSFQDGIRDRDTWLRNDKKNKRFTHDQPLALAIREALMEFVILRQWEKYGR